jgi:hypothetical protein
MASSRERRLHTAAAGLATRPAHAGAWFARGLRVPARNALLADVASSRALNASTSRVTVHHTCPTTNRRDGPQAINPTTTIATTAT